MFPSAARCFLDFQVIFKTNLYCQWSGTTVEEITETMVRQSPEKSLKKRGFCSAVQALDCGATMPWCTTHWFIPRRD